MRYVGKYKIWFQLVFSDPGSSVGNTMCGKYQFQMIFKRAARS